MEQKDLFKIVFFGILSSMGIYILLNYQTVHWEDMFVAFGTVILALFTWHLALTETEDSKQTRQIMIDEARRERRRLRIKEQLEGLYAPLIGIGRDFHELDYHRAGDHYVHRLMKEMRATYKFLATNELIELLDIYYETHFHSLKDNVAWNNLKNPILNRIQEDYTSLTEEYNDLTKAIE